jgi:hypothetical protein
MKSRISKPVTAGELNALLQKDPEFLSKKREKDRIRHQFSVALSNDERILLSELSRVGYQLTSVWDLLSTEMSYGPAIPVLVDHLRHPHMDRTREGIARALGVPEAKAYWSVLVDEYQNARQGEECGVRLGAKDGLAATLSVLAGENEFDELVGLLRDRKNGISRVNLLSSLRRSKAPSAKEIINELASDPDLSAEISTWAKR